MRFLFTCGGTAGHINPALGIAARLRQLMPDAEFLFVGVKGHMEERLVPMENFEFRSIEVSGLSRSLSAAGIAHNVKAVRELLSALPAAKAVIREFNPDVAVGTGGYVCYPVLRAADALGVPTAVHESNAVPGLTTRMLVREVDKIMVGFRESRLSYPDPEKVVVTGTPVRQDFSRHDRASSRRELNIPQDAKLVVSVWGSLGATEINKILAKLIAIEYKKHDYRLIHSAGVRGYDSMQKQLAELGVSDYDQKGLEIRDYIYDMPRVMAAADLIICRAGASTLSELGIMGKPAILVPSPNVTNNHQERNARVLESAGAAKVLLEGEFDESSLDELIASLLNSPQRLNMMASAMSRLGVPDATDRIVELILELASRQSA